MLEILHVSTSRLVLLVGMSLILGGCEQVVDVRLPEHEPRLVLFAYLNTQGAIPKFTVGHSAGFIADDVPESIPTADLVLSQNGTSLGEINYADDLNSPAEYEAAFSLDIPPNEMLRIEVSEADYPTITAEQTVPQDVWIQEVNYTGEDADPENGEIRESFDITIPDDGNVTNYYSIQVLTLDTITGDYNQKKATSPNTFLQRGIKKELLFNDAAFNGNEYTVRVLADVRHTDLPEHRILVFRLNSISEERYRYARTFRQYKESQGNPFAEPVTIFTNIQGGYGVFSLEKRHEFIFGL